MAELHVELLVELLPRQEIVHRFPRGVHCGGDNWYTHHTLQGESHNETPEYCRLRLLRYPGPGQLAPSTELPDLKFELTAPE